MNKRILWIEDDYYAIGGLVRPLELAGFKIEPATSAYDGYEKARAWQAFDLIVVDLILPLSNDNRTLPEKVASWQTEKYAGIGIVKWLLTELEVKCPVLLLSVVRDPIPNFGLEKIGVAGYLPKRGLLPSRVKEEVFKLLKIEE